MYEKYLGHALQVKGKTVEEVPDNKARKKLGQYYTPKYVVDYIVENTIGAYFKEDGLSRDKLVNLKVLDPACGSGAFLIRAYDKLRELYEEDYKRELEDREEGISTGYINEDAISQFNGLILKKNLYGVDLNEEAVEITEMNLWFRSMQKGRKLNELSHNIKVGNSLIDDPEIAGNKAFDWDKEVEEVTGGDGFDFVIGNPPYVQLSMDGIEKKQKEYLIEKYGSSMGRLNTYGFFTKLGIDILREDGRLGFIIPNTILTQDYYEQLREMILNSCKIEAIVNFSDLPFKDAIVENIILVLRKKEAEEARALNTVDIISVDENLEFLKVRTIQQNFFNTTYKKSFNIFLGSHPFSLGCLP